MTNGQRSALSMWALITKAFFVADGYDDATTNVRSLPFTRGREDQDAGTVARVRASSTRRSPVAVDSKGRLFIGERGNQSIQIVDLESARPIQRRSRLQARCLRVTTVLFVHFDRKVMPGRNSSACVLS